MRMMIKNNAASSPYWRHMGYILAQYDGLVAGYAAVAPADMVCFSSKTVKLNAMHISTAGRGGLRATPGNHFLIGVFLREKNV